MKKIIIFSTMLIGLSSCFTERIEVNLNDNNKRLVVEAWITDLDERQFVKLTNTINYIGEQETDFVSGAIVELSDANQSYTLNEETTGFYFLPDTWQAQIGDTYTLVINHEDTEYIASYTMNICPEIENLVIEVVGNIEKTDSIFIYKTVFAFQEIAGKGNAYFGVDYLKGTTAGDSLLNGGFTDDEFLDGQFIEDITLTERDRLYQIGDTAVVDIFSIDDETFLFLNDIQTETFRGGPFDAPPANIRTNISGGAVGYFIISGAKRKEIVVQ